MALGFYIGGTTGQADGTLEVPGDNSGVSVAAIGDVATVHLRDSRSGYENNETVTVTAPTDCEVSKDGVTYAASVDFTAGQITDANAALYIKRTAITTTGWIGLTTTPRLGAAATVQPVTITIQEGVSGQIEDARIINLDGSVVDDYNYGASTTSNIGDSNASLSSANRYLLKPILTGLSGLVVESAELTLTETIAGCTRVSASTDTASLYPVLRVWGEGDNNNAAADAGEVTWNSYASPNAWGTAGCDNTTSDRSATPLATLQLPRDTTPAARTFSGSGLVDWVQGVINGTTTNNGLLVACQTKENLGATTDYRTVGTSENATADNRPKLVITGYYV